VLMILTNSKSQMAFATKSVDPVIARNIAALKQPV